MTKAFLEPTVLKPENEYLIHKAFSKDSLLKLKKLKQKKNIKNIAIKGVVGTMRIKVKNKTTQRESSRAKRLDTTVIRQHFTSMDTETIKKALIANGIYDNNMKLTASYK